MKEKQTHVGDAKVQWYEKRGSEYDDSVDVIGWYEPRTGVLKGTTSKALMDVFKTEAEAEAVYGSMSWYSPFLAPSQSLNHLPGEDDFVAGGAYPDDWDSGW